VVASSRAGPGFARRLSDRGITVWTLPGPEGRVSIHELLLRCGAEGIDGVLLEGGTHLLSQALAQGQLSYIFHYTAPLYFADDRAVPVLRGLRTDAPAQAVRLAGVRHAVLGDDVLVRGHVVYPEGFRVEDARLGNG
jgi:diaminohydroxyphosphoribosylaminopyrimidine deaminase/5-amino-6-(5-phosphoribosylamino)uracil reductase